MEDKKISIITVVKNGMPFLKSAVKSFKLQDYTNKELIIVYAQSKDETESYLNSLNDENIKIKKDENSKTKFGSINIGIKLSSGEIFGLLHSDDVFYNKNTLTEISKNFEDKINCLYGNVLFSKVNNISKINRIWISGKFKKENLKFGWMPPHTSIFLRKNFIINNKEIYNEDYPISGDYYFVLKILNNPELNIKYLNLFITIMRAGGDSTNIKNLIQKFVEDVKISRLFFKHYLICISLKIFQKIFQIKIFTKQMYSSYIDELKRF